MKTKNFYAIPAMVLSILTLVSCNVDEKNEEIRRAVELELSYYPEATLQDIYKNFLQDAFGPGHMIPDTSAARAYLDYELSIMEVVDTVLWQPLGAEHNYYRINLSLVKSGVIPQHELLLAFTESANTAHPPTLEEWIMRWGEIEKVISSIKISLPNYEEDRVKIKQMLSDGEVVLHHSQVYRENYHPHYRIVSREAFDRLRRKFLSDISSPF